MYNGSKIIKDRELTERESEGNGERNIETYILLESLLDIES